MKVSVVIPSRNRAHILWRAVDSALSQSLCPHEVLVVDDHSRDDTSAVVSGLDGVTYVANNRNRGPGGARNAGIDAASGNVVAFLDSDDEWVPEHLEDSLSAMDVSGSDVCYSLWLRQRGNEWEGYPDEWLDILVGDLGIKPIGCVLPLTPWIAEYSLSKPFWCFHTDTLVATRDSLVGCGMYDEYLPSSEDLELSLRLLLRSPACLIRDYHAYYYEGDDNIVATRTDDPDKAKSHALNSIRALMRMEMVMESSPLVVDKAACRRGIHKRIGEHEVLC